MTAPNRRWPRFTLRTLFVVVTIVGYWLAYQMNWIRQRHELLEKHGALMTRLKENPLHASNFAATNYRRVKHDAEVAPGLLWLLGERPVDIVWLVYVIPFPDKVPEAFGDNDIELSKSFFPEATIKGTFWYETDAVTFVPAPNRTPSHTSLP